MTPRNPIDELFRKRLEALEEETPMHLWSAIDHSRRSRKGGLIWTRPQFSMLVASLTLAGVAWFSLQYWNVTTTPLIQSFPLREYRNTAPEPAPIAALQRTALPTAPITSKPKPIIIKKSPAAEHSAPFALPAPTEPAVSASSAILSTEASERPFAPENASFSRLPGRQIAFFNRDPQCMQFREPGVRRFFVDISAGPELPFRQIRPRTAEFNDYAHARRATESTRLSYSASLRFSLVTEFGLALRSGLQYTEFNERFEYIDNSEEKITITNIFGPNGEIIGTDTIVEKGMRRETANNAYRLLDVPLLAGYEISQDRWTVAFNGGLLLNLFLKPRGSFLSSETMRPVAFPTGSSASEAVFRNKLGVGWYASIGLHYQLHDKLQLLLEPHLRYNPRSVTADAFDVQQRYLSGGLSIGLRKQI